MQNHSCTDKYYISVSIQYTFRLLPSSGIVLIYSPPQDSIVFQDAILSSCADMRTFCMPSFQASMSPSWSIFFDRPFPLALGRSPYHILPPHHPSSDRFGWSIEWRICMAQSMVSSSMKKNSVLFTPWGLSVISFLTISRKSSYVSHEKSFLGLVGVTSKACHSDIMARYSDLCEMLGKERWSML